MIQVTPQVRVLVAVQPVGFRKGVDGLARLCRTCLASDPFSGTVFVNSAHPRDTRFQGMAQLLWSRG
jgi:hypothetical protein